MKQITIESKTYGQRTFIIDDEDFELVSKHTWFVSKGRESYYAATNFKLAKDKYLNLGMHRLIMGAPKGQLVDHIDGNTQDNRKSNLRKCGFFGNRVNSKIRSDNTTGFKGVHYRNEGIKRYYTQIDALGKSIYLGRFNTAIEGAIAYNEAAKKYHGEFARLNKI